MNRDQALRRAPGQSRFAPVALLLAAALLCWGPGASTVRAQSDEPVADEASNLFTDFYEKLRAEESKTVVYRWKEEGTVEIEGREQQLTGEQVRIDSSGDTYTVYYSEDGFLLEEYSARHQLRWPGQGGDDAGPTPPGLELIPAPSVPALPAKAPLFSDDPTAVPGYFSQPVTDPELRSDRTIMRSRPIEIPAQQLIDFSPASGRTLQIDLFADTQVEAQFTRLEQISSFSFVLSGEIVGEPFSDVTLSVVGNAVAGQIQSREHGSFQMRSISTGGTLTEVDVSELPGCGVDSNLSLNPSTGAGGQSLASASGTSYAGFEPKTSIGTPGEKLGTFGGDLGIDTPGPGAGGTNLDLLVVYTPAVIEILSQSLGGGTINGFSEVNELLMAIVHNEVFNTNTALINSAVSHRVRLVHIEAVNYEESRNPIPDSEPAQDQYDLAAASADLAAFAGLNDGEMDLIHNTRDYVGADFVHLIVAPSERLEEDGPLTLIPTDVGGLGYVRQLLTDFSSAAFALTHIGNLGGLTLAHELGHNLGLAHDRLHADIFGLFTYSFGNYFIGNSGGWRTIMSYAAGGTLGAPVFSNPNVLFDGGVTGVPIGQSGESHNAQTINLSAPSSSTWRDEVITTQMANISTRGFAGTGTETLIGGFIIESKLQLIRVDDTGTTYALDPNHPDEEDDKSEDNPIPDDPGVLKKVLIRGRGPSLAGAGLGGLLSNPQLTLFRGASVLASNLDWKDTQQAEITATGMAPSLNQESAILLHLPPGAYTVHLNGEGGGTGLGIVEIFLIEPGNRSSISTRLLDISTRGKIGVGDEALIGGFIVQGSEAADIAVIARGPSLVDPSPPISLPDSIVINDPKLEVYSGSTLIATSDNWLLEPSAVVLQEAGVAPPSIFDAATALLLSPGAYTVVVRGGGAPIMGQGIGIGSVQVVEIQDRVPRLNIPSTVTLDFGDVNWLSSKTLSVSLTNTSIVDMKIQAFNDQFASPFSSSGGLVGGTIPPQTSVSISVTFSALDPGKSYSKNILIPTNVPSTPVITLKLKGRSLVPL